MEKPVTYAVPEHVTRQEPAECRCARILKELVARGRRLEPNQPLFAASHATRVLLSGDEGTFRCRDGESRLVERERRATTIDQ